MKKIALFLVSFNLFISCKFSDSDTNNKTKDASEEVVLGGDKDENGCLASAGYTWSKLNKECLKAFTGMQLLPADDLKNDDVTMCAYVLFDESAENAEIFLPNQDESVILKKNSDVKSWSNSDYKLVSNKGYQLLKGGKMIYTGDGQIGNTVSGSGDDTIEEDKGEQ